MRILTTLRRIEHLISFCPRWRQNRREMVDDIKHYFGKIQSED